MAEGIVRHVLAQKAKDAQSMDIDSAGVSDWHQGEPPDQRAQDICLERGIDIRGQKSRPIDRNDFHHFDLILAMDQSNLDALHHSAPPDGKAKIKLMLDYAPELNLKNVPDPYSHGRENFAAIFDMLNQAIKNMLIEEKL